MSDLKEPLPIDFPRHVPGLIWFGDWLTSHKTPVIISLHGLGGNKEDIGSACVDWVTSQGLMLVTIDAYRHGNRENPVPVSDRPGGLPADEFLEVVEHTGRDLVAVIDFLRTYQNVDGDRIALHGGSLGGFIALFAASLGIKIPALVSVCGGADYVETFAWALQPDGTKDQAKQERLRRLMAEIDPLSRVDAFQTDAILMVHGLHDDVVPIAGHRRLYEALTPQFVDRPEDALFITHGGGHDTPEQLQRFAWDWLIDRVGDDLHKATEVMLNALSDPRHGWLKYRIHSKTID